MNDTSLPLAPSGRILCRDPRLGRLLETELAYIGVPAVTFPTLPPPSEDIRILLADGDEFGIDACITLAAACACPLLVFGREPAPLPSDQTNTIFLRRPFSLIELEKAIRILLDLPGLGSLSRVAAVTDPLSAPPPRPTLTAVDGTVTVGEHRVTLTPAEWAIFEYLRARPGVTVTREELAPLLGGGGNIVEVYVCHLRSKIEKPLGRRMIHTVRGVGYRMELET